jgi:hypothetical protein
MISGVDCKPFWLIPAENPVFCAFFHKKSTPACAGLNLFKPLKKKKRNRAGTLFLQDEEESVPGLMKGDNFFVLEKLSPVLSLICIIPSLYHSRLIVYVNTVSPSASTGTTNSTVLASFCRYS